MYENIYVYTTFLFGVKVSPMVTSMGVYSMSLCKLTYEEASWLQSLLILAIH